MKLLFPGNIFSKLIADLLPQNLNADISFHPSSVLSNELKKNENAAALIPAMDMINHKEFIVSSKYGLSFESALGNSYIYYNDPGRKNMKDIYLTGDVSSQEVILSKILFKELYDTSVDMHLLTDKNLENKNLIIAGDLNFSGDKFASGISFTEEIIENLNLPYVNYIFAANKKEPLEELHSIRLELADAVYSSVEDEAFGKELSQIAKEYIRSNFASVIIKFDQQDLEGLEQLLRLPYFYGMIKEIIELKFI